MTRADRFMEPDLRGIIDVAAKQWKWPDDHGATIQKATDWYVAFLRLVHSNPGGLNFIVTEEAHQLWHTHMAFECRYTQYTEAILGCDLGRHPDALPLVLTQADADVAKADYKRILGRGQVAPGHIDPNTILPDLMKPCC